MATAAVLEREEYIEQAYFFRVLRDRLAEGMATQDVLRASTRKSCPSRAFLMPSNFSRPS